MTNISFLAPLKLAKSHKRSTWIILSLFVILIDYFTGPQIRFPVLDTIIVAVCARFFTFRFALALAIVLSLAGFMLHFLWGDIGEFHILAVNEGVDAAMVICVAFVIRRLVEVQEQVRILRGFLPICADCKQIRGSDDKWYQLEAYISKHSEALFSHGICPECLKSYESELEKAASARKAPHP